MEKNKNIKRQNINHFALYCGFYLHFSGYFFHSFFYLKKKKFFWFHFLRFFQSQFTVLWLNSFRSCTDSPFLTPTVQMAEDTSNTLPAHSSYYFQFLRPIQFISKRTPDATRFNCPITPLTFKDCIFFSHFLFIYLFFCCQCWLANFPWSACMYIFFSFELLICKEAGCI